MTIKEFEANIKNEKIKKAKFTNIYGEEFTVYFDGITVYFGGDETDQEIILMFNDKFNIWSNDELVLLGKALIEVGGK